ncbi:MAG: hypothetical protein Q7V88_01190 [Actinomycetota bacterium]|nr:hypothetical protein [Actinomycetota bacterium]
MFALVYAEEEHFAQSDAEMANIFYRQQGLSVDSACFNVFEIDAGTWDGGYGIDGPNGAHYACP